MRKSVQTYIIAGAVGGGLGGLFVAVQNPGSITRASLQFAREGAVSVLICAILGAAVAAVLEGLARAVVRIGNAEPSDVSWVRTIAAVGLAGGIGMAFPPASEDISQWLTVGLITLLAIAIFSLPNFQRRAAGAPALAAWVCAAFVAIGVGSLYARAVMAGRSAPGIWQVLVVIVVAAGAGSLCWYVVAWLVETLSARAGQSLVVGVFVGLLVVPVVGLSTWAMASSGGLNLDAQVAQISGSEAASDRPNIILISVDTLRADAVGYSGGDLTTPAFDALAEESYIFENAYAIGPWTRPSFASVLSSRYPSEMGVGRFRGEIPYAWRTDRVMLAEAAKEAGYATAAVVTNHNLTPQANTDQGFDIFYNCEMHAENLPATAKKVLDILHEPDPTSIRELQRADEVSPRVVHLLEQMSQRPLLMWAHYMDPHLAYDPPTLEKSKQVKAVGGIDSARAGAILKAATREKYINAYHAEVEYCDMWIQKVINQLKSSDLWDSSIVVFWSDHGEEFWDHGGFEHGQSLHDELVQIPLLIHLPGQTESHRIEQTVTLLDIMPTLIDYCDASAPADMQGQSLRGLMEGNDDYTCSAFLECCNWGVARKALVTDRYKLIYDMYHDDFVLYDMQDDPQERHDIHGTSLAPDTAEMEQELRGWVDETQALMAEHLSGTNADTSPEIRQNLKDMGYIQ